MAGTRDLALRITAKDEATKEIKGVSNSVGNLSQKVTALSTGYLAVSSALKEALKYFKQVYDAAAKQEMSAVALNTALNTESTNEFSKSLQLLASRLQETSVYEDDDIIRMQALLVSYGKTSKEVEDQSALLVNLASKMSLAAGRTVTLQEAWNLYVSALNGMERPLRQYAISLDKTVLLSKDASEITKELALQVNGAAEAFKNTDTGKVNSLKNAFGDFLEVVGARLRTSKLAKFTEEYLRFYTALLSMKDYPKEVIDSFNELEQYLSGRGRALQMPGIDQNFQAGSYLRYLSDTLRDQERLGKLSTESIIEMIEKVYQAERKKFEGGYFIISDDDRAKLEKLRQTMIGIVAAKEYEKKTTQEQIDLDAEKRKQDDANAKKRSEALEQQRQNEKEIYENKYKYLFETEQLTTEEYLTELKRRRDGFVMFTSDWIKYDSEIRNIERSNFEEFNIRTGEQATAAVTMWGTVNSALSDSLQDPLFYTDQLMNSLSEIYDGEWSLGEGLQKAGQQLLKMLVMIIAKQLVVYGLMKLIGLVTGGVSNVAGGIAGAASGGVSGGISGGVGSALNTVNPGALPVPVNSLNMQPAITLIYEAPLGIASQEEIAKDVVKTISTVQQSQGRFVK